MADKTLAVTSKRAMLIFNHAIHRQYPFNVNKWDDNNLVAITMDKEHWKETIKSEKYIEKIYKQKLNNETKNCPGCEFIAMKQAELASCEKYAVHMNHCQFDLISKI